MTLDLRIGDCLQYLKEDVANSIVYDAIVTDPPYEISLHKKKWDSTGISFSPELWGLFFDLLKPGAFIASFAASRLYHRLGCAAEDAGFIVYPFLSWEFDNGLPKPANLSELFDRDIFGKDRRIIGSQRGSGYTRANVEQGAQNRSKTTFDRLERHVSDEGRRWKGFYYGLNCFRPIIEPILLAQKPISHKRMIDNIREFGTGALNLTGMGRPDQWPTTKLKHKKARRAEHNSMHPSVKPLSLMVELCQIVCPPGGLILDPFAGTGTTGVAAIEAGMPCRLVELNPEMEPIIFRRCLEVAEDEGDCILRPGPY